MKRAATIISALLAGLAVACAGITAHAAARVGVNSAVQGDVFVYGVNDKIERRARVRQGVFLGDRITTRKQSALQVLLLDETVFTVGQDATLVINRFVYDPDKASGNVSAAVLTGAFRFMTGRIGKANPSAMQINTPTATIGIRGTIVEGAVGANAIQIAQLAGLSTHGADTAKATVIVLRGPGPDKNTGDKVGRVKVTSGGVSVTIDQPGWAVFVPYPGAAPVGPFRVNQQMLALLDIKLRSTPSGPGIDPLGIDPSGTRNAGQDLPNTPSAGDPLIDDQIITEIIEDDLQTDPPAPPKNMNNLSGGNK